MRRYVPAWETGMMVGGITGWNLTGHEVMEHCKAVAAEPAVRG